MEFQNFKISQADSSDSEHGRRIVTQPNVLDFDAVDKEFFVQSSYASTGMRNQSCFQRTSLISNIVSGSLQLLSSQEQEQTRNGMQVEAVLINGNNSNAFNFDHINT